jgi:hypothetical protein
MTTLRGDDPVHVTFVLAVRAGNRDALEDLFRAHPDFPASIVDDGNGKAAASRTRLPTGLATSPADRLWPACCSLPEPISRRRTGRSAPLDNAVG